MSEKPVVSQEAQGSYIAQATGGGTATIQVYTSPPSLENQKRARFLARLHTRYRELLEQSLHGAVRMTLQLADSPDAVTPPVQLLYETDQPCTLPLPAGTSLLQVYADAGQELLLLGAPGAGKSTLLLELAYDLVKQAEQDHSQLLPVIVPLSSWASQRQPLEQWLASQVALHYDLSLHLCQRWVQEERLLPLLDGLDEMEEEARAACIAVINAYHREHLHPLVIASRKAEYEAAAARTRLVLHHAVVVQPLTREQVDAYLAQCGEAVVALRTVLQKNAVLQELATTPLMLSILILTYQGRAVSELPTTTSLSEQQLFARYVERMVARKEPLLRFSPQDLISWLGWLARQMRERNQTVFYLEHVQPDSLPDAQQRSYEWWAVRLPALLIGILTGITTVIIFHSSGSSLLPQYATIGGLLGWHFSRPASSLGTVSTSLASAHCKEYLRRLGKGVLPGIVMGLIVIQGWEVLLGNGFGSRDWLGESFIPGLVISISSPVLSLLLPSFSSEDAAATSRRMRHRPFLIQASQTILGQRAWLAFVILGIGYGLGYGLSLGLLYWLLLGLFQGIESSRIEDHTRRFPNQGIRRSLQNSVLLALISSVLIGVIGIVSFVSGRTLGEVLIDVQMGAPLLEALNIVLIRIPPILLPGELSSGLLLAVCGGLLVCASRGGLAVLRHYVIRLLLARSHTFPWHAPRFLEEATARILLRRVGGGYSFPHRLLLDYFVAIRESDI